MEAIVELLLRLLLKLVSALPKAIYLGLRRRYLLLFRRRHIRDEAKRLEPALKSWFAGRRRQTSESAGDVIQASALALRELARFLALNLALPWRRYRIFGEADGLRREIADDKQAATRFGLTDVEPGPGGWRAHYAAFLLDYRQAFGEAADVSFWRLPAKDEEPGDKDLPGIAN